MRYITPIMVVALLGLTSGPGIAADQTNTKDAQKSGGLGLTNRPSAGGGMGEDTTPAGSAEGPRALPPGRAPGMRERIKAGRPRRGLEASGILVLLRVRLKIRFHVRGQDARFVRACSRNGHARNHCLGA
jgi:hypothetical protein